MNKAATITFWGGLGRFLLLMAGVLCLCTCSSDSQEEAYLIRVGTSTVTVAEFKREVEASAEEVFPGEQTIAPAALNELRKRVLKQLSEDLIIAERAKQLDIHVTDQELEAAVDAVKADYPDDTFEKTLLENAVSYQAWKKKMATRLLMDKVINKELVDNVQITEEDVSAYFQKQFPEGLPQDEEADKINEKIVQHLRQQKAEAMYQGWMDKLKASFPVDVDQKLWKRLVASKS
jgi:hypothetical protein